MLCLVKWKNGNGRAEGKRNGSGNTHDDDGGGGDGYESQCHY